MLKTKKRRSTITITPNNTTFFDLKLYSCHHQHHLKLLFKKLCHKLIFLLSIATFLILTLNHQCTPYGPSSLIAPVEAQRFLDSSTLKPSIFLILPQTLKVPTNPLQDEKQADEQTKLQQYVALINNAQNEQEDQALRQQYKRLTLQIRDARSPITGQLFYEHTFDYFPSNRQHLLVPIDLEQVSAVQERASSRRPTASRSISASYASVLGGAALDEPRTVNRPQQVIISVRPHQLDSGFGSENIEFVSSAPILVEPVPSRDGRRSFTIVQTDKPVYKPDEKVRIRCLVINEIFRPIVRDELRLQIRNPHDVVVEEIRFPRPPNDSYTSPTTDSNTSSEPLFLDHEFDFPPEPMLGPWSVHLLHSDPVANDTTTFIVKEYVLPPFEIQFSSPQYVLPHTENITGHIVAKYHYGKPVHGTAHFKFGYIQQHHHNGHFGAPPRVRFIARSPVKKIDPTSGRVEYRMSTDRFKEYDWFPRIAGSPLVVEAVVTEMSTGHTETSQDSSCVFLRMPYRFVFEDSIEDFKPGLTQQLTVQLIEQQSHKPVSAGHKIFAQYLDQNKTSLGPSAQAAANKPVDFRERLDTEAITDASGRATFNIGPLRDDITSIRVKLTLYNSTNARSNHIELAYGEHALMRHDSQNGWVSLMNKSITHLNVGDSFVSDLLIRDAVVIPQKIFYLVVARGQILLLDTLNSEGLVQFQITEMMMPSIRLVLFALTHDSIGLLSDSMRINVGQDLNCGLELAYKSARQHNNKDNDTSGTLRPNERGSIDIKARQGDVVSLIGVDSAVYTLYNRSRLSSDRIIQRVKMLDAGCGFGGGRNNMDVFHNAGLMLFRDVAGVGPAELANNYVGSACETSPNKWKYSEETRLGYMKPMHLYQNEMRKRIANMAAASQPLTRPKRDVDVEGILRRYKDPIHKACCRLGTYEDIPLNRDCEDRSKIVDKYMLHRVEYKSCGGIYHDCCRAVFGERNLNLGFMVGKSSSVESRIEGRRIVESYQAPQLYVDGNFLQLPNVGQLEMIEMGTLVRQDFRETWLFDLVSVEDESGRANLSVQLPHSITSWSVAGMALNPYRPMCLMTKPLQLVTFQSIFLQLSMPYKVVQGEQIDLVASVYNYSPEPQDVLVYMYGQEDVCSEAEPGERSQRKRLRIDKHQSQSVLFPMIPLKTGKYPIKVVAVALNSNNQSDIIERKLSVVPRGKTVTDETTFSLDPMNHQKRSKRAIQTGNLVDEIDSSKGVQRSKVRLAPSRDSEYIVPQTQECIVSAIGDKVGAAVQTTLLDVENLIRLPHGCGEQVMIYLGPTLYTFKYLSSMNKLTGHNRWKAIRYIQSGYKRILNYREEAGGFSAFAKREPSIWLTAFVAKLLCQTERTAFVADQIHVDKTVVNSALNWLIERQDNTTGTWIELHPVYHREMLGGVLKENALTAFVTLTLNECLHHSTELVDEPNTTGHPGSHPERYESSSASDSVQASTSSGASPTGLDKLRVALQKAEGALVHDHYMAVKEKNPYVLALAAYALSRSRPHNALAILKDLMLFAERSHSRNQLYWRGDYQIETAAYALQALIELAPIMSSTGEEFGGNWLGRGPAPFLKPGADAVAIANWLSSKRTYTGAFDSTQDTVVALEALTKFAQLQPSPNGQSLIPGSSAEAANDIPSLVCNVTINNRTRRSIEFGKDNSQVLQTFKLDSFDLENSINGEMLDIFTSGTGLGQMTVKLKYNVFQDEDELCRFNIDSSIEEWIPPDISESSSGTHQNSPSKQSKADGHLTGKDRQGSGDNESTEGDYFKAFDKSMLDELSLSKGGANVPSSTPGPATVEKQRRRSAEVPILRLKRLSSSRQEDQQEGWASRMVTSLKSKLPSWMVPGKSSSSSTNSSSSTTTSRPTGPVIATTRMSLGLGGLSVISTKSHDFESPRSRSMTSRRSAGRSPAISLVTTPTGIPAGAHLNHLSKQLEFSPAKAPLNSSSTGVGGDSSQGGPLSDQQAAVQMADAARRLVLLLRVCVHHLSSKRDSEMAVVEVGILSGFKPNEADLKMIVSEPETPTMKYEMSADRSLLVFYMAHIPHTGPYCMQFRLIRDSLVHNLQSGYIRAYEYYSPTHACSSFYTPSRITGLIQTKCDSSGQVCQCAANSLCPATKRLVDLSEIHQVNTTSARTQLTDLVCSDKFDLVSLVRLKHVRYLETGNMFKLTVKVKSDLKGNLTKIIEQQRQQKSQLLNGVRKPRTDDPTVGSPLVAVQPGGEPSSSGNNKENLQSGSFEEDNNNNDNDASLLDHLNLNIEASCVRDDPLLLHLAHPSQWKQGGELMILFARSDRLERRLFRVVAKSSASTLGVGGRSPALGPAPKAAILSSSSQQQQSAAEQQQQQQQRQLTFDDAQQIQYSLSLSLDRSSILHDVTYQAKSSSREPINNLILWLELRSRRERWTCPS